MRRVTVARQVAICPEQPRWRMGDAWSATKASRFSLPSSLPRFCSSSIIQRSGAARGRAAARLECGGATSSAPGHLLGQEGQAAAPDRLGCAAQESLRRSDPRLRALRRKMRVISVIEQGPVANIDWNFAFNRPQIRRAITSMQARYLSLTAYPHGSNPCSLSSA
jgi:hypothetical protein